MDGGLPTERFGRYLIRERLGRGGMAEVYRATLVGPRGFSKDVAIKRLRRDGEGSRLAVRMVREAKLAASLQHPCLVQILELGERDGEPFIVMEFVRGRSLAAVLDRGPAPPLPVVLHVAAEICRGLEHAHGLCNPQGHPVGLVHRDVKPANVMLGFDGSVKVLDFGIALLTTPLGGRAAPSFAGSPAYMSPEQVEGGALDRRSDLYWVQIHVYIQ